MGEPLLLALVTLGATGCLSFCHPIDPLPPEQAAECKAIPEPCLNHVHVFFIHGMDPLDLANLAGVVEYVQKLGFIKTHYGQMYHTWQFKKDLRRIAKEDPEARFAIVGFSFGANMARNLTNAVKGDGVLIDLLIYLGGNTLDNTPPNRPEHVLRIVNILAHGYVWNGANLDGAENLEYTDVGHFGSPTHNQTLIVLRQELAVVARRVPIIERVEPALPPTGPTPHPLNATPIPAPTAVPTAAKPGEWNFLEPTASPGSVAGRPPTQQALDSPPATMLKR